MQLAFATAGLAQSSPDTRSPVIELEAIAESQADEAQVFVAQVVDDRALKDVALYYRRSGQQPFAPIPMTQIGDSAYYTASVTTQPNDLRAIEYYIQARDEGGNRTVEGYAFDPYTRVLIASESVAVSSVNASASTSTPTTDSNRVGNNVRWWQIAAGVLIVGALASAAGGDSGSEEPTVPLTLNLTGL